MVSSFQEIMFYLREIDVYANNKCLNKYVMNVM